MKSGLLQLSFLASAAIAAIFAFNPAASAQDVGQLNMAQQAAPPPNMRPGIRYTTGAVTTAGWEKSLTDGDPNLKRWNWSAMTSYTQSCYGKVAPGAYVKKINRPGEQTALKPAGSIYVKPIQVSPETYAKKRVQPGVIVVGDTRTGTNLSGKVRIPRHNQIAEAPQPEAKSYNVNYVSGSLRTPQNDSYASRQVSGRLMRTQ